MNYLEKIFPLLGLGACIIKLVFLNLSSYKHWFIVYQNLSYNPKCLESKRALILSKLKYEV